MLKHDHTLIAGHQHTKTMQSGKTSTLDQSQHTFFDGGSSRSPPCSVNPGTVTTSAPDAASMSRFKRRFAWSTALHTGVLNLYSAVLRYKSARSTPGCSNSY